MPPATTPIPPHQPYAEPSEVAPGKDPLRRTLPISEIFCSVQGESTHAGRPSVFVRVAGCPLHCVWCDTEYALDFKSGPRRTLAEILAEVERHAGGWPSTGGVSLITLTGGEPLAHVAVAALAEALLDRGCEVLVFTSGAFWLDQLPRGAKRIVDIKCPDSGESASFRHDNLAALRSGDEVKFVCASRRDFDFAVEFVRSGQLPAGLPILFSPAAPRVSERQLAEWFLGVSPSLPNARMQIQMHKAIWPERDRGY